MRSLLWTSLFLSLAIGGCDPSKDDTGASGNTDADDDVTDVDADDTGNVEDTDADGDGFNASDDCDDTNAGINPDATEVCDGVDNNCDGETDEGLLTAYYSDNDGDGYGGIDSMVEACDPIEGMIEEGGDCDDENAEVYPGLDVLEFCDGIDNDCDGEVDGDSAVDMTFFFEDADEDGFGALLSFVEACEAPDGYTSDNTDCDDTDAEIHPSADEICDGLDNDCDETIDIEAVDAPTWYRDADGDTFGNDDVAEISCDEIAGYVLTSGDCDDADARINPDGTETCNSADDDCDGSIDEDFELETYYRDVDGDEYGDSTDTVVHCERPSGYVTVGDDCDDDEYWANPGLSELCDEIDNDCDGEIDEESVYVDFYPDADSDGYGDASGDPINACAPPSGYVVDATDCDDGDATVSPGMIESCNGVDDDCDGELDEGLELVTFYLDEDGDGYGIEDSTVDACSTPAGYADVDTDCDDENPTTYPGAYEMCDEEDDDCNGEIDDDCGDSPILGAYGTAVCDDEDGNIEEEGDYIRVNYNPDGTWMNTDAAGFEIGDGEEYYEACYPGSPWQVVSIEWESGDASHSFTGNYSGSTWNWDTTCAGRLGDGETVAGVIHEWEMDDLVVTKTEIWELEGHVSRIWFDVDNVGDDDVTDLDIMFAVDPDQDMSIDSGTTYATLNDVSDDGDIATSVGPTSGRAFLFGSCDSDAQVLGHTSPWSSDDDFTPTDYDEASGDNAMNWGHRDISISAGDSTDVGFLVTVGEDRESAEAAYEDAEYILCSSL
ncbi:MAG: putative metal-binding motif-containing protein [Myxococcota bacterium]